MLAKSFFGALLALSPAVALAQTAPRLYVGASGVLMRFYPFETYASTRVGPAATLGVQLSPRWAVESGAQLTWGKGVIENIYATPGGTPEFYRYSYRLTDLVVPLQVRFTVTEATAPLHADILGGISWLHSAGSGSNSYSNAGVVSSYDYSGSSDYFCVGLGPQVRYSLGSHLDVKLNVPLSLRVNRTYTEDFSRRLFFTPQLGVQYAFGG